MSGTAGTSEKWRSCIWTYFVIISADDSYVKCIVCNAKLSRGGLDPRSYSTSPMITHLHTKRVSEFKKYLKYSNTAAELAKSETPKRFNRAATTTKSGFGIRFGSPNL